MWPLTATDARDRRQRSISRGRMLLDRARQHHTETPDARSATRSGRFRRNRGESGSSGRRLPEQHRRLSQPARMNSSTVRWMLNAAPQTLSASTSSGSCYAPLMRTMPSQTENLTRRKSLTGGCSICVPITTGVERDAQSENPVGTCRGVGGTARRSWTRYGSRRSALSARSVRGLGQAPVPPSHSGRR